MQEFERGDDYRILWKRINNAREKFVLLDCPSDILVDVINASIGYNMTGSFNVSTKKQFCILKPRTKFDYFLNQQHLFLTNLDTHLSGIDGFYSRDFTVAVAAVRIRTYVPPPVHDEIDVFDNSVDTRVKSKNPT